MNSSVATLTTSLQYTPPNAATNSGSVLYPIQVPYNAQSVGSFDILNTETAPVVNNIPFGSITQCLSLVIENGQATDIGIKINGGVQLSGTAASISFATGVNTITGLNGMAQEMVGKSITIAGSATPANNGTFVILGVTSLTTITVINAAGVTDSSGHIVWVLDMTLNNFKIPPGGLFTFSAPKAPNYPNTPNAFITSCSVTSYAVPAINNVESISWYVFGD